jgi:hypothetical protein
LDQSEGGAVKTVSDLLAWAEAAPPGTSVPAASLIDALRQIGAEPPAHITPGDGQGTAPVTWAVRLWQVPAQTRLGPVEMLEAVGRPKSWLYRHTGPKAPSRIPHRKLDGALVFVAGEVRQWIEEHEEIVVAGRGPLLVTGRKRSA